MPREPSSTGPSCVQKYILCTSIGYFDMKPLTFDYKYSLPYIYSWPSWPCGSCPPAPTCWTTPSSWGAWDRTGGTPQAGGSCTRNWETDKYTLKMPYAIKFMHIWIMWKLQIVLQYSRMGDHQGTSQVVLKASESGGQNLNVKLKLKISMLELNNFPDGC